MSAFKYLPIALSMLVVIPICEAQTEIDPYGFYRSWKELNDRYYAKEVELDEHGMEIGTDTNTEKLSDKGLFRVFVEPKDPVVSGEDQAAPPFNKIHTWIVSVQPVDGSSPDDIKLEFFGGMPLHNHGFPTSPKISKIDESGEFLLNGVKFSMKGWWQFAFAIKRADIVDTVRVNLVISH